MPIVLRAEQEDGWHELQDWAGPPGSSQLERHLHGQTPTLCLFRLGLANLHTSRLLEGFPIPGPDPDRQERAKSACMTHGLALQHRQDFAVPYPSLGERLQTDRGQG